MLIGTLTDKEREILKLIEDTICAKYLGKLRVCYDETIDSYILYLYMNREMTPIMLSKQGSWEDFCEYIKSELIYRRLQEISSWSCKQVDEPK